MPSTLRALVSSLALLVACGPEVVPPSAPAAQSPAAVAPAAGGTQPPSATAGAGEANAARATRLDAALSRAIREQRIVGAVVLVAEDGKVVYRRAIGLSDREAKTPMSEDAVFRLASVTKPFVTVAALALVDAGKLRLDDPVTKWLPDFQPKGPDGKPATITIAQLMTHTSGLGYRFLQPAGGSYHKAGVSDGLDEPGRSWAENQKRLVSVPLLSAPGAAFHYSLSIDVLGEVVARAHGGDLPAAVRALVTGPLGIGGASFAVADATRLAVPYADGNPPLRMGALQEVPLFGMATRFAPGRALDPASYPSGGAGMNGTAADVLRLLEALRMRSGKVVSAKTAAAMMENHTGALTAPELGAGWGFGWGGAVLVDPQAAKTPMTAGSFRWGGAWGHSWFVDTAKRITVVALTNTAFEGMIGKLPNDIAAAVYGP